MKVPLLDLSRTYRELEPEIVQAVEKLLRSQRMILGPAVHRFEQSLAALCGSMFAVGCASGSDALLLALLAAGVKPGDEVVTTAFSFFATAGSIHRAGAAPVFVDIDPQTFNINPELIERAMTKRTKALLPVHLYGQAADMDGIMAAADRTGLPVIEDAAQAIGAHYHHKVCGAIGLIGCLSFYPTKNLGAAGDAGACLTDDEALAEELKSLRVHGAIPDEPYVHHSVGKNSRLDAVQAVILSVKMKHLREWNETRRRLARYYTEGLAPVEEVTPPYVAEDGEHVFHQYVIRVPRRDKLETYLKHRGVGTRVFYPVPLHLQPCFKSLGGKKGDFPEAERACREVLALPIYPGLTREEQDYVVESIRRFFAGGRSRVSVVGGDAEV
ncbi:MAG: transcriptional regulator [Planctomycetes bacterium SM23_65]|nr:MAG: transcriptional regulator [Planctomycetes bacterium SM23_65]